MLKVKKGFLLHFKVNVTKYRTCQLISIIDFYIMLGILS